MSDFPRPMSRRALIKSAAMAPVLAAAANVFAEPTEKNQHEFDALADDPPAGEEKDVKDDSDPKLPIPKQKQTFKNTYKILWKAYRLGTKGAKSAGGLKQFKNAYFYRTGDALIANIKLDKIPEDGKHNATTYCAYICGHKALLRATQDNPGDPRISLDNYKKAWDETEKEIKGKFKKLLKEVSDVTPDDLGMGC